LYPPLTSCPHCLPTFYTILPVISLTVLLSSLSSNSLHPPPCSIPHCPPLLAVFPQSTPSSLLYPSLSSYPRCLPTVYTILPVISPTVLLSSLSSRSVHPPPCSIPHCPPLFAVFQQSIPFSLFQTSLSSSHHCLPTVYTFLPVLSSTVLLSSLSSHSIHPPPSSIPHCPPLLFVFPQSTPSFLFYPSLSSCPRCLPTFYTLLPVLSLTVLLSSLSSHSLHHPPCSIPHCPPVLVVFPQPTPSSLFYPSLTSSPHCLPTVYTLLPVLSLTDLLSSLSPHSLHSPPCSIPH